MDLDFLQRNETTTIHSAMMDAALLALLRLGQSVMEGLSPLKMLDNIELLGPLQMQEKLLVK